MITDHRQEINLNYGEFLIISGKIVSRIKLITTKLPKKLNNKKSEIDHEKGLTRELLDLYFDTWMFSKELLKRYDPDNYLRSCPFVTCQQKYNFIIEINAFIFSVRLKFNSTYGKFGDSIEPLYKREISKFNQTNQSA